MSLRIIAGFLLSLAAAGCTVENSAPETHQEGNNLNVDQGDVCGGFAGIACGEGLYCKFAPEAMCGAADASGTCEASPEACTKELAPVCGCDGETYGNACDAASSGVSVAHEGECPPEVGSEGNDICGGYAGIPCAAGFYCDYPPEASCGAGDQTGLCAETPEGCNQIYEPVCGCDGKTYGNSCEAAISGVSVSHEGECK